MSTFIGTEPVELRRYDDPKNPKKSNYKVGTLITTLDSVVDADTGETAAEILRAFENKISTNSGDNGVTILGVYPTLANLRNAHPTGHMGDAYIVGGKIYVWNSIEGNWTGLDFANNQYTDEIAEDIADALERACDFIDTRINREVAT